MSNAAPPDFARRFAVSRETIARLEIYADMLTRWQQKINLVSPNSLPFLWERHIADSAQLYGLLRDKNAPLLDLGSGAGFPGLVLAIMGMQSVHLAEADLKKSAFLREVARATNSAVTIHAQRIEAITPFAARYITARALAPLDKLLELSAPFTGPETEFFFLKGAQASAEIAQANQDWPIAPIFYPSQTENDAVIINFTLPASKTAFSYQQGTPE